MFIINTDKKEIISVNSKVLKFSDIMDHILFWHTDDTLIITPIIMKLENYDEYVFMEFEDILANLLISMRKEK